MKPLTILPVFFLLLTLSVRPLAYAGALDDFESASNPRTSSSPQESTSSDNNRHYDHDDDSFANFLFELMMESFWYASLMGGEISSKRYVSTVESDGIKPRNIGEPLIPQYRFDFHYQDANAGIKSTDYRFEYGEGKFGIQLRTTSMIEGNNDDRLWLNQFHALYRMSFGNHFGINYGIGIAQLIGNSRKTSLSMSFPIYFHPSEYFGLEMKTGFHFFQNADILDLDYSAIFTQQMGSISIGYRELVKAGLDITGPYVGFSLHY